MHEIRYVNFTEETSKDYISNFVHEFVTTHGDCYGTESIRFRNMTFDSYEEARDFIEEHDNVSYGGIAVKFKDSYDLKNKKIIGLENRIQEIKKTKLEYAKKNFVGNRKSAFIGCPICESKLNRKYLKDNFCPVCGEDLRSNTVRDTLDRYYRRIKELEKQIREEKNSDTKKYIPSIKWLVKFEYHL